MLQYGSRAIGSGSDHEFSRATVDHAWEHGREHIHGLNALIDEMKPMELGLDLRIYDMDAKTLKPQEVKAKL